MKKIGIFDIHFTPEQRQKFYRYCDEIFDEAYLTNHSFCRRFEKEFAQFADSAFSLSCSNGTAALDMALKALEVRGRKVILPSNTFIATYMACLNAGAQPVICDVEEQYYGLCPKSLQEKIDDQVGAVVTVHIGGHISPDLIDIQDICQKHNIPVVEDAAHAHGAQLNGKPAGSFGAFGTFSHFLTKIMTTGERGSVVCQSEELYQKARSVRRFGMNLEKSTEHLSEGSNYKMSEFQAALGLIELERIQSRIERRRHLAKIYQSKLAGSNWVCLKDSSLSTGSYYKQIVFSPIERATLTKELQNKGIPLTGYVYDQPLHKQPFVQKNQRDLKLSDFPISENFSTNHFCPPCYPEITDEQVEFICDELLKLAT